MGRFARVSMLRRTIVVVSAALVLMVVAPVAAGATSPPSHQVTRLSGMQPAPLSRSGARLEKAAAAATVLHLRLYFQSPDEAALQDAARAIASPSSPEYRHYLTVDQFRALYAPPAATTDAVNSYLTSAGVTVGPLDPNGMSEQVSGTVKELNVVLHTTMDQVQTATGAQVVGATEAPAMPANLATSISFIDGLTPWVRAHDDIAAAPMRPAARPLSSGAKPDQTSPAIPATQECADLSTAAASNPAMDPAELASAYKLSGFYNKSDNGQAETIGLVEYDTYDQPAVKGWEGCLKVSPTVYTTTDGTINSSAAPATIEATSDIETLMGLAPSANIAVYESANASGVDLNPWTEAIGGVSGVPRPAVISSSWGLCEAETPSSAYTAESNLFSEALMQGQTIFVASGDQGSEACFDPSSSSPDEALAVNDPASNPLVTAVGGTSSDTVTGPQYVWNSNDGSSCLGSPNSCTPGASGGGLSSVWEQPSYQPANATLQSGCSSATLTESPVSGTGSTGCREVPDVSAFAGNLYWEACTDEPGGPCDLGGSAGSQYLVPVGGTSLAAPSWAGTIALADNQCGTNLGFLNQILYSDTANSHADVGLITSGNNDFTGTNNELYPTDPTGAQNLATGLGYLGGVDLSSGVLCQVPSPPSGLKATVGTGSVQLSWNAPTYQGRSLITGYSVTVAGASACTSTGATSCTVSGLTNGTPYRLTFSVRAKNGQGTGPASSTISGWFTPVPSVSFPGFSHVAGAATAISEGADGVVWVVGTATTSGGHPLYERVGAGWLLRPGGATGIAVGPNGNPWVVNNVGQIFQWIGSGWLHMPGAAVAISIGANGSVWVLGSAVVAGGHPIYRWTGSSWVQEPGAATAIAVGPSGNPWVTNTGGAIFQWNGSSWNVQPGSAVAIGEGSDGAVWVLGSGAASGGHPIFTWTVSGWASRPGAATGIAVGPTGDPWVVNSARAIYSS
jgi:subtilase family serine protease